MTFNLAEALPRLLPRVISWAEGQSAAIRAGGNPLSSNGLALARAVGVVAPEHIRVKVVGRLPLPDDAELRDAALETGLLGPEMVGLTLGYGIYVCHGHLTNRLLSHEYRHVHQYEAAGSIAAYLPIYLAPIVAHGYERAPFEVDARSHERDAT